MLVSRRHFFSGLAAAAGLVQLSRAAILREGSAASERHFEIEEIHRTTVRMEFREVPRRNMDREIPHWRYAEICEVRLKCGVVGVGETLLFYTWGATTDAAVERVRGGSAVQLMWDDSLGAGLQMALFDAVGRAAEVPVHALLGT
ncbi:MAG: dgoA protein, partial [Planctomycetaceae bacterium]